ncbi:MAG: hypothetical protein HEQ32_05535 [Vampirovibrio sp.]
MSTLPNHTSLNNCVFFENLDFSDAVFKGNVYFKSSEFLGTVNFYRAIFKQWCDLDETYFELPLKFEYSIFEGLLGLDNMRLKNTADPVSFKSIFIKESFSTILNFEQANYPKLLFKSLISTEAVKRLTIVALKNKEEDQIVFESCVMPKNSIDVTSSQMKSITIKNGNWFQGLDLAYCTWPILNGYRTLNSLTLKALELTDKDTKAEVYSYLKKITSELGQAQVSNDFYFQQMQSTHQTVWHHLYRITSSYGLSFKRPLFCFLGGIILFMLINFFIFEYNKLSKYTLVNYLIMLIELSLKNSFIIPVNISINTVSSILPSYSLPSIIYAISSLVQHIIQTFLFIQMGLAIKNKIRR